MTANRRAKHATRARMAATGEEYTQARRVLAGPPPGGVEHDVWTDCDEGDPIGYFTDQAYNVILLAEDDARMLGCAHVEPEHLLLAASRHGNVQRLLLRPGIDASAIHAQIVRLVGFGGELVLGRVPRDPRAHAALQAAIIAAWERGSGSPSSEHLLLGLAAAERPTAVLSTLGVTDIVGLVDAYYPTRRPALEPAQSQRRAFVARTRDAPRPGPMPPLFERFTVEARTAIDAALADARTSHHEHLTPVHILAELLRCEHGVVARARAHTPQPFDPALRRATELLEQEHVHRASVATMFSPAARTLVAEDVLAVAHRLGHRPLTTGHLLIALLAVSNDNTLESVRGTIDDTEALIHDIATRLPGDEHY